MHFRTRSVEIKGPREIEAMRRVCSMAAETLVLVDQLVRPGITTDEINAFVHADTVRRGAVPAPLNYRGGGDLPPFPRSCCTSVNDVVCHGIPSAEVLAEGDIVNIDVTHLFDGFHGDTSATYYVGEPKQEAKHVTEVARRSLELAIAEVRPGARLGDIGAAIQTFAEAQGCSVVRDFVGHGIGRKFHEEPKVEHYGRRGTGIRLKPGMIFTIEPMINLGGWEIEVLEDEWTAITADGSLSAQFEHTVLVTETGVEVLTARAASLPHSERFPGHFT